MKRPCHALALALLACSAAGEEAVQGETFPLRWVALSEPHEHVTPECVWLDAERCGEMPFALPSGRLRFRLEPANRIRIDRNDDGVFDDRDRPLVRPGQPAIVTMRLGDEPQNYRLSVTVSEDAEQTCLHVSSLTALETREVPARFRLLDANCNGRFDETLAKHPDGGCDLLQWGNDAPVFLQQFLPLDGRLFRLELAGPPPSLRCSPHAGPFAQLVVDTRPGFVVSVSLEHRKTGYLFDASTGQTALAFTGPHRISCLTLSYFNPLDREAEDEDPVLVLFGADRQPEIGLREGIDERAFGPPLKLEFHATRSPSDAARVEIREVWLTGAAGERYSTFNHGAGDPSTLECGLRDGEEWLAVEGFGHDADGLFGRLLAVPAKIAGSPRAELVLRFAQKVLGRQEVSVELGKLLHEPTSRSALLEAAGRMQRERPADALKTYEEAVAAHPDDPLVLNNAAWFLVSTEAPEVRDPQRALVWARKAVQLTGEENGNYLDTLAVALHEAGQLEEAARLAQRAAELSDDEDIAQRARAYADELKRRR